MTQRTINLYDGLEALYYFDSDYFDGTTGEIEDKSGHERHATAVGGPTVGVNGPNDFEAANFSGGGSGDVFEFTNPDLDSITDAFTICIIRKHQTDYADDESYKYFEAPEDGGFGRFYLATEVRYNKPYLSFRVGDGSSNVTVPSPSDAQSGNVIKVSQGEWYTHIGRVEENGKIQSIVDGVVDKQVDYGTFGGLGNNYNIGANHNGDIALLGIWSRALSDAEIKYLNSLTAPRRAKL